MIETDFKSSDHAIKKPLLGLHLMLPPPHVDTLHSALIRYIRDVREGRPSLSRPGCRSAQHKAHSKLRKRNQEARWTGKVLSKARAGV